MQDNANKVPIDLIDDPRIAMRETTKDDSIDELMKDMHAVGLIEPVVLRKQGERYEIIAGHRRTTAARLLGWASIEAKIVDADDTTVFAMRAIENLSRRNTDATEEAAYLGEIMLREKKTAEQIASMVHRSLPWVESRLAVFEMPDYLKNALRLRQVSLGAALELAQISDENTRRYYCNYAALNGVSVGTARQWRLTCNMTPPLNDEQRQEILQSQAHIQEERKIITCSRCGKPCYLDRAESVWVHPVDCSIDSPGPLS